jgi:hypothetical protein
LEELVMHGNAAMHMRRPDWVKTGPKSDAGIESGQPQNQALLMAKGTSG